MIKLQYRPPDARDNTADSAPLPNAAPECREHADTADDCTCGIPRDVRTIILYSLKQREKNG